MSEDTKAVTFECEAIGFAKFQDGVPDMYQSGNTGFQMAIYDVAPSFEADYMVLLRIRIKRELGYFSRGPQPIEGRP